MVVHHMDTAVKFSGETGSSLMASGKTAGHGDVVRPRRGSLRSPPRDPSAQPGGLGGADICIGPHFLIKFLRGDGLMLIVSISVDEDGHGQKINAKFLRLRRVSPLFVSVMTATLIYILL